MLDLAGLFERLLSELRDQTHHHLSLIDMGACTGCGTCVEWCPTDAIALNEDEVALRDESACLGCGVCARFCPESTISLREGLHKVFIMPPRLRTS